MLHPPRARAQVRDERVPQIRGRDVVSSTPRREEVERRRRGPGVVQELYARRRVLRVGTVLHFAQERLGLGEEGFDGLWCCCC